MATAPKVFISRKEKITVLKLVKECDEAKLALLEKLLGIITMNIGDCDGINDDGGLELP